MFVEFSVLGVDGEGLFASMPAKELAKELLGLVLSLGDVDVVIDLGATAGRADDSLELPSTSAVLDMDGSSPTPIFPVTDLKAKLFA